MSTKVACLKWGDKYSVDYVNKLYRSVCRNSRIEEFHCITDNYSGIDENIICHPIPDLGLEGWWYKVSLFNPEFYPTLTNEVLFLDLDIVITDSIQPYLSISRTEEIITMKDPWLPGMNSSVMRWDRSQLGWVWDKFLTCKKVGRPKQYYELDGVVFQGDQNFLDHVITKKQHFPDHWTRGWKAHGKSAVIEQNPRIVIFNGKPDPHEIVKEVKWIEAAWR